MNPDNDVALNPEPAVRWHLDAFDDVAVEDHEFDDDEELIDDDEDETCLRYTDDLL